jgi:hypothetical protein
MDQLVLILIDRAPVLVAAAAAPLPLPLALGLSHPSPHPQPWPHTQRADSVPGAGADETLFGYEGCLYIHAHLSLCLTLYLGWGAMASSRPRSRARSRSGCRPARRSGIKHCRTTVASTAASPSLPPRRFARGSSRRRSRLFAGLCGGARLRHDLQRRRLRLFAGLWGGVRLRHDLQ